MSRNPLRKRVSFLPAFSLSISALLLILTSCKDKKTGGDGSPEKSGFKMNCVILTKQQIQTWVDSGWTRPANQGSVKEILFQFYSESTAVGSKMQLIAYPGESASNVEINGEQILKIDTSCKPISFTGKIILANNEINIEKLNILNPDGTLNDFDFIRFTPKQFNKNREYISFGIEKVIKGSTQTMDISGTRPCPPWCCPPSCVEP